LVDAARRAGLDRFVFTSILTCDKAPGAPHLWQKKLIEDHLEASGVPFVSVRPGAFVGAQDFWARIADASSSDHRRVATGNPFYVDPGQLLLELREQRSRTGAGTTH
jgi:uncharacterized protein YbjT (DUF2867 family)